MAMAMAMEDLVLRAAAASTYSPGAGSCHGDQGATALVTEI